MYRKNFKISNSKTSIMFDNIRLIRIRQIELIIYFICLLCYLIHYKNLSNIEKTNKTWTKKNLPVYLKEVNTMIKENRIKYHNYTHFHGIIIPF